MRIMFTNDDGFDSIGLHAVADLFKEEHEIAVVAPDVQKSGFSHSITLKPSTLKCYSVDGYGYPVYSLTGTPVDCVKVGVFQLFPMPDVVISGMNLGQNLGSDIMYSGTVSAATDAAHLGIKAFALSFDGKADAEEGIKRSAEFFKRNFDALINMDIPKRSFLNINFPHSEPKGIKIVKMSVSDTFKDAYIAEQAGFAPNGHRDYSKLDTETDEALCRNGYITISPLMTDRTDYGTLKKIKKEKLVL